MTKEPLTSNFREVLRSPTLGLEQIRRILDYDPLRSVFFSSLRSQYANSIRGMAPFGNYYEFGVGWGGSLVRYIRALKSFRRTVPKRAMSFNIMLFDTFEGMPDKQDSRDDNPTWRKGLWNHSIDEIKEVIRKEGIDPDGRNIHFIKGEYRESLTSDLRNRLLESPPSIINMDVDYYSSTVIALDWLRPLMKTGTTIYFDDIWGFHGNPLLGQFGAINAFNQPNDGWLIPCPELGTLTTSDRIYKYARKSFEYGTDIQV